MKNNMKIMMMIVAGIAAALVVVALPPTTVYGQQTTATPTEPPSSTTTSEIPLTAAARQIIADAQTACTERTAPVLGPLCVSVVYESPTILVLTGQLAIVIGGGEIGYQENPYIWQAVDGFKAQGYTLNSVQLGGQGSQGNPHSWYIVMSK
jgi:hypothetical protein